MSIKIQSLSRFRLSLLRWLDLTLLGTFAACAVLVGLGFFGSHQLTLKVSEVLAYPWLLGTALGALALTMGIRNRDRIPAFLGLRHIHSYPPAWIGAAIGFLEVFLWVWFLPPIGGLSGLHTASSGLRPLWSFLTVPALAFVALLGHSVAIRWQARRSAGAENLDELDFSDPMSAFPTYEKLKRWFDDDRPVLVPEQSTFTHARIARRIVSRLMEQEPPAHAVVGRLGSGKSTLFNLIQAYLQKSEKASHIKMVKVELWPYETTRAAVMGVISLLVEELAQEVNVLEIKGIPSKYADAMGAAGGPWSALVKAQGTPGNPNESLRKFGEIATAIGIKFIVWIDDLERFAGISDAKFEPAKEAERLGPLRALLLGLDSTPSLSVITATTTLQTRFDLEKIARYVERIPDMDPVAVARILAMFRRECRAQYPGLVDPAEPDGRESLDMLASIGPQFFRKDFERLGASIPAVALSTLCQTPRTLKQGLRRCQRIWESLRGEIDLDHVLCACVLREAAPNVFAVVEAFADYLPGAGELGHGQQGRKGPFQESLDSLGLEQRLFEAAMTLVEFLFGPNSQRCFPQGFAAKGERGISYWDRFMSEFSSGDHDADQTYLNDILQGDVPVWVRRLESKNDGAAFLDFRRMVDPERAFQILLPLVKRRVTENPSLWIDDEPPGISTLASLWPRWNGQVGEACSSTAMKTLGEAFSAAMPFNLALARKLEATFLAPKGLDAHIFPETTREKLKAQYFDWVRTTFAGSPRRLSQALEGAQCSVLYWVCWGRERYSNPFGEPFSGWQEFADTILESAVQAPSIMIPQLAPFMVQEGRSDTKPFLHFRFDPDACKRLFGGPARIGEVIKKTGEAAWAKDPQARVVLDAMATELHGDPFQPFGSGVPGRNAVE